MDVIIISIVVFYDLKGISIFKNLMVNSINIVKLKMYGLEEVVFINILFICVEQLLGLFVNIIKMGIMDEECCILVNLKVCIFEVKNCVVFINIGFLDCIGDEIYILM